LVPLRKKVPKEEDYCVRISETGALRCHAQGAAMTRTRISPAYPIDNSRQPANALGTRKQRPAWVRGAGLLQASAIAFASLMLVSNTSAQESIIVALGDSNTAGYRVDQQQAYPAKLETLLRGRGQEVNVINAGVPGDTFGGMLSRIDLSVPQGTSVVIVQGGYNDLSTGVPPDETISNLDAILSRLHSRGIKTVLCGFFDKSWDAIGRRLAATHRATFVPGSACYDPHYVGSDGLHMSETGHQIVAGRLTGVVQTAARRNRVKRIEVR
jgi:acyl-CoA thioesterase I